jgi:Ca-activated chloride channel family protein
MTYRTLLSILSGFILLSPASTAPQQETLRVDVRLVNLVATVTNPDGRYVEGLGADDFIVEDDGVEQEIVHFTQDRNIPVSLGFVLDTSGSMQSRMRTALAAIERFIGTLHEEDDVFVMTFSGGVTLIQDLTSDREELSRSLSRVRAVGGTALYDALSESLDKVYEGRHDKRAVLLLTDGDDTSSDLEFDETLEAVRKSELLLYPLGIDPTRFADPAEHVTFEWPLSPIPGARGLPRSVGGDEEPVDMDVLRSFARASGGKAYLVPSTWTGGSATEIDVVLDEVSAELRSQYTLGYYPTTPADGRRHELHVRTRTGDYQVRARTGYFAP